MSAGTTCRFCGTTIPWIEPSSISTASCPNCGASVLDHTVNSNPYAAPLSPLNVDPQDEWIGTPDARRTSLVAKFAEAIRLFASNFILFSLIILTVWLPANLIINVMVYSADDAQTQVSLERVSQLFEAVFGPIYVGGLIHAASLRKSGKRVSYSEAMSVGVRRWGALFGTRLITGLIIMLGLIALIVPGVILAFRYALIDPIVVLERRTGSEARNRSQQLMKTYKFQMFIAGFLMFMILMVLAALAFGVLSVVEPLNNFLVATLLDCVLNIGGSLILILLFLIYHESQSLQSAAEPAEIYGPNA